jgi:hypothetical protein
VSYADLLFSLHRGPTHTPLIPELRNANWERHVSDPNTLSEPVYGDYLLLLESLPFSVSPPHSCTFRGRRWSKTGPKRCFCLSGLFNKLTRFLTLNSQHRRNNFGSLKPVWIYSGLERLFLYPYKTHLSVPVG